MYCNDAKVCKILCDRTAEEHAQKAPLLANYVMTILMGLSAAARDGLSQLELQIIGEIAATGRSAHMV